MKDEKSHVEIILEETGDDIEKLKTIIRRIEGELELTRKERDNEKHLKKVYEKMFKDHFYAFKQVCSYLSDNAGFPIPMFNYEQWSNYFLKISEMEECIKEDE